MRDSETATEFVPWRDRARLNGIRSTVAIPLVIEGGWRGALVVSSALADAFDLISIEVFQQLAGQIGEGIHAAAQARLLLAERENLARVQGQLTEALSAMVGPMVAHGGRHGDARPLHGRPREPYGSNRGCHCPGDGLARGPIARVARGRAGA
jgi:GAF domain-containing protein